MTTVAEEKNGASAVTRARENPPSRKSAEHYWHQVLHIVVMRGEILSQPIQQVLIPCRLLHVVHWLDESAAHEPLPQTIDHGAREPSVLPLGDNLSQPFEPGRFVGLGVSSAQFRVEELQLGLLAGRLVAMDHFKRAVRVDAGQAVGIRSEEHKSELQ